MPYLVTSFPISSFDVQERPAKRKLFSILIVSSLQVIKFQHIFYAFCVICWSRLLSPLFLQIQVLFTVTISGRISLSYNFRLKQFRSLATNISNDVQKKDTNSLWSRYVLFTFCFALFNISVESQTQKIALSQMMQNFSSLQRFQSIQFNSLQHLDHNLDSLLPLDVLCPRVGLYSPFFGMTTELPQVKGRIIVLGIPSFGSEAFLRPGNATDRKEPNSKIFLKIITWQM